MVAATTIQVGDLEIDLTSKLVRKAGLAVNLSRQQRALLEMLVRNANQTLTHQQLLQEVWGDGYGDESRYILHMAIKRLREKVGDSCIVGENNIGYRFNTKQPFYEPSSVAVAAPAAVPVLYIPSPTFTNLPSPRTSFVGRSDEKRVIHDLLMQSETRLVTLTGPGGTGKTRLALEVATGLVDIFTNGTVFVPLAAVTEPHMVLRAIAQTLSIKEQVSDQPIETIISAIRDKHLLLILDNFEQVLAAAPSISELLTGCASIKVLVTSRSVLQLYGEHEYLVPPLALPNQQNTYPLDVLPTFSAIALFVERARAGNRLFNLTEDNAQAVTSICTRLDGLPLAIELVTARVKYLSPQALWDRLQNNTALSLLTGGPRDLDTRQQTLRAAISWSYDLLAPDEQQLFKRLGVFEDGYGIEAIERVCNVIGDLLLDPFDGMVALMDKSLVHFQQDAEGNTHFGMLQTIREFAQEQLTACGERELLAQRHAVYYFEIVEHTGAGSGYDKIAWLNRLELEHDNVRQGLRWFLRSGDAESALKMCSSLWDFWYTRGHFREGRRWLAEAFRGRKGVSDDTIAKACYADGILAVALGLYDSAISSFEEALHIWEEQENKEGLAHIFHSMGLIHMRRNEQDNAMGLFEQAHNLSYEANNLRGVVSALQNMGSISLQRSDYNGAQAYFWNALEIARKEDFTLGIVMGLAALGSTAYWQKRYTQSVQYYKESLQINQQLNDQDALVICIESLGLAAYDIGEFRTAAILFSAGAKHRKIMGWPVIESQARRLQKQKILSAEGQYGEQWALWWMEGTSLQLEEVVQYIHRNL